MEQLDAKAIREKMGLSGVIIMGFNNADESLSTLIDGEVSLGIAATELLSAFYANVLRKDDDMDDEALSTIGALVCTKALKDATERLEND